MTDDFPFDDDDDIEDIDEVEYTNPPLENNREEESISTSPVGATEVSHHIQVPSYIHSLIKLNTDGQYYEPTCDVCNSTHRLELEKIWNRTQSITTIHKYLNDNGLEISDDVLTNHFSYHNIDANTAELKKTEYLADLIRLKEQNISSVDHIDDALNTIKLQMVKIQGLSPTNSVDKIKLMQIQSAETTKLVGAMDKLLKLQKEARTEQQKSGEFIYIKKTKFIDIFNEVIRSARTVDERRILSTLIEKIQSSTSEM